VYERHPLQRAARTALLGVAAILALSLPVNAASALGDTFEAVVVKAKSAWRSKPITFKANEMARVEVRGDGTSELDLHVYDTAGALVAADERAGDRCLAEWTPAETGKFVIVVTNRSAVWNRCTVATN
jgi:hypothetical protein